MVFSRIKKAGEKNMDNMCVFTNWVLKGDIKIDSIGNGKKKASFALSSPRPNKAGVWNKNYYVAFGAVAEMIEKCNIQSGTTITIYSEQQVYTDKQGAMRHNYLVTDFQLPLKSKSDNKQEQKPQNTTNTNEQTVSINPNANLQGYDEMIAFMNN